MNKKFTSLKYIKAEIDIIIKNVKLYPTNLQLSFRVSKTEIKEKLNRERRVVSIHKKYYTHIRHKYTIFTNESSNGSVFVNVKNTPVRNNKNIFDIADDFKLLSYEDKKRLLDTLMSHL